jgi:hypothetical protein
MRAMAGGSNAIVPPGEQALKRGFTDRSKYKDPDEVAAQPSGHSSRPARSAATWWCPRSVRQR